MLDILVILVFTIFVVVNIKLDITNKISVTHKKVMIFYLVLAPHIFLGQFILSYFLEQSGVGRISRGFLVLELWIFILYIGLRLNLFPIKNDKIGNTRLSVMLGGRTIMLCGLYSVVGEIIYLIVINQYTTINYLDNPTAIIDLILSFLIIAILLLNGSLRILFTSKRLGIVKRIIILFSFWIPIINLIVILYACHIVRLEYDHECYKVISNNERIESQVCATKYPLLMVHGIGFRDLKYINYWGRIPKYLIKNGAKIYYGNQEAWGTVESNANDIKEKIFEILKENNCEKVNIIAHSKGGLDARYMISKLRMAGYVASLTMISTPHRGSGILTVLCKLPEGVYKGICNLIDKYYKKIGDNNPDAYTSSRQLLPEYAMKFNEEIKDVSSVYYQSYMSVMKNCFSHFLLFIPYLILKPMEGENDGLIGVESSKWGNFRGVIRNKYRRGISHGDIIDIKREDYKGFDVLEKHLEIVSELKKMGY